MYWPQLDQWTKRVWFSSFRGEDLNMKVYDDGRPIDTKWWQKLTWPLAKQAKIKSNNLNCSYIATSSLTYIPGFSMQFIFLPINTDYANYAYFGTRSHLNLLLWNCKIFGRDGLYMTLFQNFVRQPWPPFKMAVFISKYAQFA
jgi:hypothetical protein